VERNDVAVWEKMEIASFNATETVMTMFNSSGFLTHCVRLVREAYNKYCCPHLALKCVALCF